MDDWAKILITAVVSSVSTALVTEPVKLFVVEKLRQRRLRRQVYRELAKNYDILMALLVDAENKKLDFMREHFQSQFASYYKRECYRMASADRYMFLQLKDADGLATAYSLLDGLVDFKGKDDDAVIEEADMRADLLSLAMVDGRLSKRMLMKYSSNVLRKHIEAETSPENEDNSEDATIKFVVLREPSLQRSVEHLRESEQNSEGTGET
jgi:hypothetical protein